MCNWKQLHRNLFFKVPFIDIIAQREFIEMISELVCFAVIFLNGILFVSQFKKDMIWISSDDPPHPQWGI